MKTGVLLDPPQNEPILHFQDASKSHLGRGVITDDKFWEGILRTFALIFQEPPPKAEGQFTKGIRQTSGGFGIKNRELPPWDLEAD